MQNYRLLFTENNTNDRYLILLNISALKCPDSDTVATDLQKITDHLAIYQSGREGIKMVLEHYKNTYPDLNYTICRIDNDGFHGELFHYYDAFLEKEYLDGKYMKSILTESEFQTWRDDTEQYETYPDLTVDTKIGKIYAKTVPGSFPGILIECETSNTAGTPGALLEYDETKKKMMLRVYGIQNPYGNPIESYEMSK